MITVISRRARKAIVTAGLKWAPDTGPNRTMMTTRMAPVGMVLPNKAMATFPPRQTLSHDAGADHGREKKGGTDELRQSVFGQPSDAL